MKKLLFAAILTFCLILLFTSAVYAQTPTPPPPPKSEMANLFTWAATNPPDWTLGILYGVLGLAGALITIYFVMGGTIPTSAGIKLEAEYKTLELKEKELSELRKKALEDAHSVNPELIREFSLDADRLRDDLERKSRYMFISWAILYIFLGIFFAMMLAQDLLQAITIGAGWTSLLAAFGLYRENRDTKSEVARQVEELEKSVKVIERMLTQLKARSGDEKLAWDEQLNFEQAVETVEDAMRRAKLRTKAF